MRYVEAKLKIQQQDTAYRFYVTDALNGILDNTANYLGMSGMVDCGKHLNKRFSEIIDPQPEARSKYEDDDRTATEFATDMWKRMKKKRG